MNLEVGNTIGDYQIIGTLGAGGMGKVFKVRNTISDRIEAMKVLLPDLAGEPDLADRFLREIKVLASLDHPNIAGLRTALRLENQLLMLMEFVEGETLDQRLHRGPLPVDEAARCMSDVLAALAYAHKQGVIHRDIKPANMMLMPDGTVKLMDFGIAKGATDRKLTMTGTTMGSLYYMSPEQIRGLQGLDPRSDLYSVGVSLYELVTGKRPFDGDSQFAIMSAHLEKTPVPPITIDPSLPPALNDLILLSVNREPEGRFQSADAFRKALSSITAAPTLPLAQAAAAAPAPPAAPAPQAAPPRAAQAPPPSAAPVAQPARSHRALWATVGALCCVGALVAVIQFGPWKKTAAGSPANEPAATSVPAPAQQPAQAPASTPPASTPTQQPSAPAASAQPATSLPASSAPAVQKPIRKDASSAATTHAPQTAPGGVVPPPTTQAAPPKPEPAASAPIPSAPATQAPAPQPDAAAHRAELQKLRISLATMSARATSVHSTLKSMQQSQARSGLNLRGDWLQAASLMDTFFQGANDAIAAGDTSAAQDLMDKGERQLEILEKGLNK